MLKAQSVNDHNLLKDVYLNNAAAAFPLAPGVRETVADCLAAPPASPGRGDGGIDHIRECRHNLARLLGAAAEELVLVPSATMALNVAILGLGLTAGDMVITSVMEHNSVLRPLARLEDREGIRLEFVALDETGALDRMAYERLLQEKPALVVLSHASNVTGRINPVTEWFALARDAGAKTLLDAGQTTGRISVKPKELNADMAAFSGYKGLRGPPGTGALYVAAGIELEPVFTGGTGVMSELRLQPEAMPLRLESGSPNIPAFAGLSAAAAWCFAEREWIRETERRITSRLVSGLAAIPEVRLCDPSCTERTPVVSFTIAGQEAEETGYALREGFGIRCRTGLHCAPLIHRHLGFPTGSVRFSPSCMTTEEEIDYTLDAVSRIGWA